MTLHTHLLNGIHIAELVSDQVLIRNAEEGLELMANLYYQEFDSIILQEKNLVAGFFDLKNGLAGEILQKFSNYRMRLAIIGQFDAYTAGSIRDFIVESNKAGNINFVSSLHHALQKLSKPLG